MAARIDYTICRKRPKKRQGASNNFGTEEASLFGETLDCFYKQ